MSGQKPHRQVPLPRTNVPLPVDWLFPGLRSRSRRLDLETVSSRTKNCQRLDLVSGLGRQTSRSRLGRGHLGLVPKTNFRPNCAGHINKTSQFWASRECFSFTAASAGAFCIHSRFSALRPQSERFSLFQQALQQVNESLAEVV